MTKDERIILVDIATFSLDEEKTKEAMRKLKEVNNTYHWCFEWDHLVICDEDDEFTFCTCLEDT